MICIQNSFKLNHIEITQRSGQVWWMWPDGVLNISHPKTPNWTNLDNPSLLVPLTVMAVVIIISVPPNSIYLLLQKLEITWPWFIGLYHDPCSHQLSNVKKERQSKQAHDFFILRVGKKSVELLDALLGYNLCIRSSSLSNKKQDLFN